MSLILGLDVGTASAAGATKRDGRVQPCALGQRTATLPAVVVLREDGNALVGEEAERIAGLELTRIARRIRRDPLLHTSPITVGGEVRTPHELLRTLYATMAQKVSLQHGSSPTHVVLAHPAMPEGTNCEWVEALADELFPGALVVPDSVAATVKLACDAVLPPKALVAVYDLGGGTFDTSLVQRHGDRFSIIGDPAGHDTFGGIDIDDLVLDHVDRTLGGAIARVDLVDPAALAALARLRAECRDAKERLSYDTEVTIDASLPGAPALVHLTRAQFDAALQPYVEATVDTLVEMLDRSGVRASDVDAVALVGGSARIPVVGEIVAARTGMHVLVDPYPELTVALGTVQMMDDDAAPSSVFPIADLGSLPSLANLGPLKPFEDLGPDDPTRVETGIPVGPRAADGIPVGPRAEDHRTGMDPTQRDVEIDALLDSQGHAAAGPAIGPAAGVRFGPPPVPPRAYDSAEFDMGGEESPLRLAGQNVSARAGVAVLSALAGVILVVAGALALGGGGGGGGDQASAQPDSGNVDALGSDDTQGDPSGDTSTSSSSSVSTSTSSSSSTTTADDGGDDPDDEEPRPSRPDPTRPTPSTSRPAPITAPPGPPPPPPPPVTEPPSSSTSTTSSTTTSTTTTVPAGQTASSTTSEDVFAPAAREVDRDG